MTPPGQRHSSNRRHWLLGAGGLLLVPGLVPAQATAPSPVLTPRPLVFPRDHGTHNETRTEWWYLTGHAQAPSGRTFGFQVTFFRSRVDAAQPLQSRLAARQLLFAHAAITDLQGNAAAARPAHRALERRAAAAARARRVRPRRRSAGGAARLVHSARWRRRLPHRVAGDGFAISLRATPTQAILLQGDQGFSRKGPDPSRPAFTSPTRSSRCKARSRCAGQRLTVTGQAWLDHEWSEAILHPEAVGWDWIGMNLDNGDSLTAFQLRRADGSALWAGGSYRAAVHGTEPAGRAGVRTG